MKNFLENFFQLNANKTNIRTEITAGITSFLTCVYIIFINPAILASTGMNPSAVFVATCLTAAIGTLIMGLYANYPIVLAPSMSLNAYFAYTIVASMGYSWQVALTIVLMAAILFLIFSMLSIREKIIIAIPSSIKTAIVAGIGLLLAVIALKNLGIIVDNQSGFLELGNLKNPEIILCILGFFLITILDLRKIPGTILISMLTITIISITLGLTTFKGIVSLPPSITAILFQLDFKSILDLGVILTITTLFFVAFFDNTGTLLGLLIQANPEWIKDSKRFGRALQTNSIATIIGAMLGTSTVGTYVESAVGIRAGGRTGLTAITVAILFLLALLFAPLSKTIPIYATSAALLFVACLMARNIAAFEWNDISETTPALITALLIPLTFSVAIGVSFGFISFVAIKTLSGRIRQISPLMWILTFLFGVYLWNQI